MASDACPIPETHVLAIASHVVYGNVGNTMVAQALQLMGCEVAALDTVHFSNHTGYGRWRGTKASADEIRDLYAGLTRNGLTDFDVLLSGYAPGAAAVQAVGDIARDLKARTKAQRGREVFWVLDPVMGDEGKLYVSDEVVPAYKALVPAADLILPNQFELEVLTDQSLASFADLRSAIARVHALGVPHVVVTSVRLPAGNADAHAPPTRTLAVVGSSRDPLTLAPRLFRIDVPELPCYFSGTGDLFAALLVARLREAVAAVPGLAAQPLWLSEGTVDAVDLPLCRAVQLVLASMGRVLDYTQKRRDRTLLDRPAAKGGDAAEKEENEERHVVETKAAEIRLARCAEWLVRPGIVYGAVPL